MENRAITIPPFEVEDLNKKDWHYKELKFCKRFHPEFEGYLTEFKGGIWISLISAKEIGQGHFSLLIKELKKKYSFIKIPTPSKMIMGISIHLGFKIKTEFFGSPYNEMGTIMLWEKRTLNNRKR